MKSRSLYQLAAHDDDQGTLTTLSLHKPNQSKLLSKQIKQIVVDEKKALARLFGRFYLPFPSMLSCFQLELNLEYTWCLCCYSCLTAPLALHQVPLFSSPSNFLIFQLSVQPKNAISAMSMTPTLIFVLNF